MDDRRFDAFTRAVDGLSRRGLLARAGFLVTGVLVGDAPNVGLGRKQHKKRKKGKRCSPACGPCGRCANGRCAPVANRTPCGRCRECIGGECVNLPNDTICGTSCEQCRGGACEAVADDSPCDGDGKCFSGVCNPSPGCVGVDGSCSFDEDCCTGNCNAGFRCFHLPSLPDGAECQVADDCVSGRCLGYRCTGAGLCPSRTGSDYCHDGTSWGDAEQTCPCVIGLPASNRFEFVRAAAQPQRPGFACGDCATTQDCIDTWGPDAFCALDTGDFCPCAQGQRFCALPC